MEISKTRQNEKFNILEKRAIELSHLALEMLNKTEEYCAHGREEVRDEVIKTLEPRMNEAEDELSVLCIQFLATEKPVVKMLRAVVMFLKMSTEFERVADLSKGIVLSCERYFNLQGTSCGQHIAPLMKMAKEMLERAVDCFENKKEGEAHAIATLDRQVNATRLEIAATTLKRISKNPQNSLSDYEILVMAQKLERIGDLCTNIAEETIYMESGEMKQH